MGAVKNLWMDIADEIHEITGNSYKECMEIAMPLAQQVIETGSCELPDGSIFPILNGKAKDEDIQKK